MTGGKPFTGREDHDILKRMSISLERSLRGMNEDIYQLYLDEIEAIPPCDPAENAALAVLLAAGEDGAK